MDEAVDFEVISKEGPHINLDGVDTATWRQKRAFSTDADIFFIDLEVKHWYNKLDNDRVGSRVSKVSENIQPFLRTGGTVIVFLSGKAIDQYGNRIADNYSILRTLGIEVTDGVQEYNCLAKTDDKALREYVDIVGSSTQYIEFDQAEFEDITELISRGENGAVCGAAFRSYQGTDNGTLVVLPRPSSLATRSETWFTATIGLVLPYVPKHTKNKLEQDSSEESNGVTERSPLKKILLLCERFPKIARQLRDRYDDRDTLQITDEYDVQDLFHALLHLEFDDIRDEEYSPSHAGSASRIDFLLKRKTIGIELKYVGEKDMEKRLKNELSEDKEHYGAHPSCEQLICFIYDPEFAIDNPRGFEDDMSGPTEDLETTIVISPR